MKLNETDGKKEGERENEWGDESEIRVEMPSKMDGIGVGLDSFRCPYFLEF